MSVSEIRVCRCSSLCAVEEGDVPFCDAVIGRQAVLQVRPRRDVTAESVLEVSVTQTVGFPPRDQRCDDVLQMDLQERKNNRFNDNSAQFLLKQKLCFLHAK